MLRDRGAGGPALLASPCLALYPLEFFLGMGVFRQVSLDMSSYVFRSMCLLGACRGQGLTSGVLLNCSPP